MLKPCEMRPLETVERTTAEFAGAFQEFHVIVTALPCAPVVGTLTEMYGLVLFGGAHFNGSGQPP